MVDRDDEPLSVSFLLPNASDDEYVLRSGVLHRAGTWCWQNLGIEGGGVQSRRQASKPAAAGTTGAGRAGGRRPKLASERYKAASECTVYRQSGCC